MLSKRILYGIFVAANITSSWQAVGLANATHYPIHVYIRSDAAGVVDTWARFLRAKGQSDLKGVGIYSDPGIVDALKGDSWGIGYNNLADATTIRRNSCRELS